jgi:hypothetical protein
MRVARPPHLFVVGPGDDRHLVDTHALFQLLDAGGDLGPGADERVAPESLDAILVVGL